MRSKNLKKPLAAGAALVALCSSVLNSAIAADGNGAASAVLLAPVSVTQAVSGTLNFGAFTIAGSGTATIETDNDRVVTGAVNAQAGAGLEGRGELSITALTGVPLVIEFSGAPGATFTLSNGTATMVVGNFNIGTVSAGDQVTVTLTTSPQIFPVGATFYAMPGQPTGTYTGTYSVSTTYQ